MKESDVTRDDILKMPFINEYIEDAIKKLSTFAKRQLTEEEIAKLKDKVVEHCKNRPVVILNTHKNIRVNSTLGELAGWIRTRKPERPVITGHGTLFKPHKEYRSVVGELITFLMKTRKVAKNEMFELMRNGRSKNDPLVKALNIRQLIFKLIANSFYGAISISTLVPSCSNV